MCVVLRFALWLALRFQTLFCLLGEFCLREKKCRKNCCIHSAVAIPVSDSSGQCPPAGDRGTHSTCHLKETHCLPGAWIWDMEKLPKLFWPSLTPHFSSIWYCWGNMNIIQSEYRALGLTVRGMWVQVVVSVLLVRCEEERTDTACKPLVAQLASSIGFWFLQSGDPIWESTSAWERWDPLH